MSFISDLVAGGAAGLFQGIGTFAKDIRAAITGEAIIDPNKRAELLLQAQTLEAAAEQAKLDYDVKMSTAQTAINEIEAKNASLFVSGWRPATGWVCVIGLFYTFVGKPLIPWFVMVICGLFGSPYVVPLLPAIDVSELMVLLGGMLGLGAMRTYEKVTAKKIDGK